MIQFLDDDGGFRSWISRNPRGYVVNGLSADSFVLHRGSCLHLYDDRNGIKVTATEKSCGLDKHDVIQHAKSRFDAGRATLKKPIQIATEH